MPLLASGSLSLRVTSLFVLALVCYGGQVQRSLREGHLRILGGLYAACTECLILLMRDIALTHLCKLMTVAPLAAHLCS